MKSLKKMRHDLELASEQMSSDLEKLQEDSQKQEVHISKTLEAVQKQQEAANALLQSDWPDAEKSRFYKEIESWSVADVINWLQNKNLHKFIILFQKHRVTGKELLDLKLPFLESYDHISLEEREQLLSEIYSLLNPSTIHASEEDLTKIKSPFDRQKYLAAVELAQNRSSQLQKSSSVLVLPTQRTSSKSSSSSQSSPATRQRHRSESSPAGKLQASVAEFRIKDTKKRRTLPKIKKTPTTKSLFECVQSYGPQCIRCVTILKKDGGLGVTMTTSSEGHVIIGQVSDDLKSQLQSGDRVLELNGRQLRSPFSDMNNLLRDSSNLVQLVILSQSQEKICTGNGYSEENWHRLRSLLVDMRDADTDTETDSGTSALSTDQLQYLKHSAALQDEVKKLQKRQMEKEALCEKLQADIDDQAAMMHDLEVSRDKAIEKLKQSRGRVKHTNRRESMGGEEYYNVTMESLKPDTSTKEEVIDALKDVVKEASKQKWYLDRLISLVIEESPWLLDEVDSEFDNMTLTDQSEEFC